MTSPTAVPAAAAPAPAPAPEKKGQLRSRLMRGSIFEIGGYGAQQILRLGSNLILTRLLFPAAFGLSVLVFTIMGGLHMIAETGFGNCVVQSKRGDEPDFLNTVFTVHAIRGVVLSVLMVTLAKPAAWVFREPELEVLVYIGSLQLFFNGFHATSVMSLRRHLNYGWNNVLDLGQQVISIAVMLTIASYRPVPAALVWGSVVGNFCYGVATHFLPVGYRNRFKWKWDKEALHELSTFGRWVTGSTAAAFLGVQSDRILLGRFLGAAWLGVYGVGLSLSEIVNAVSFRVITVVIYPALSKVARDSNRDFPSFYYRLRLRLDLLTMTGAGFLAGIGPWLVHALWDPRYQSAQWIVEILCVRVALASLISPAEWGLIAQGLTRYSFWRSVIRLVANIVLVPIGWHFWGPVGVMWATIASELPTGLAVWPQARRLGILKLHRELLSIAILLTAFAAGWGLRHLLPDARLHLHLHH
jgi:O-antigen/teichoic acid export membrane protein